MFSIAVMLLSLLTGLLIVGFIAFVAYFVIKKAVKDALKEYDNEKNRN